MFGERVFLVVEVAHVPAAGHIANDVFCPAARITFERQIPADEDAPGDVGPTGLSFSSRMRTGHPMTGLPTVSGASRRSARVARAPMPTSVAVVDDVAVCVHEPSRKARIRPGPAGYHHLQRPQRVSHVFGQVEDACQDDRHGRQRVGLILRCLGQRGLGVEAPQGQCRAPRTNARISMPNSNP
jgi:hypothetical protein